MARKRRRSWCNCGPRRICWPTLSWSRDKSCAGWTGWRPAWPPRRSRRASPRSSTQLAVPAWPPRPVPSRPRPCCPAARPGCRTWRLGFRLALALNPLRPPRSACPRVRPSPCIPMGWWKAAPGRSTTDWPRCRTLSVPPWPGPVARSGAPAGWLPRCCAIMARTTSPSSWPASAHEDRLRLTLGRVKTCTGIRSAGARAAVRSGGRRDVEGGVAAEEAGGLEAEPAPAHRHHGPVLRPREVRGPERVPDDNVRAVNVLVSRDERGHTRSTGMLVDEVASRVAVRRIVSGHPQMVGGKNSPRIQRRPRISQQRRRGLRIQREADRTAEPVGHLGVDDPPDPVPLGRGPPPGLRLPAQPRHRLDQRITERILRPDCAPLHVDLLDRLRRAVAHHVQPGAEEVLVSGCAQARRDLRRVRVILARIGRGEQNPGQLHLALDHAIQVEVPVEAVVVVADSGEERHDQAALAAGLGRAVEDIGVLPEDAEVLLVDADRVADHPRLALVVGDCRVEIGDLA